MQSGTTTAAAHAHKAVNITTPTIIRLRDFCWGERTAKIWSRYFFFVFRYIHWSSCEWNNYLPLGVAYLHLVHQRWSWGLRWLEGSEFDRNVVEGSWEERSGSESCLTVSDWWWSDKDLNFGLLVSWFAWCLIPLWQRDVAVRCGHQREVGQVCSNRDNIFQQQRSWFVG